MIGKVNEWLNNCRSVPELKKQIGLLETRIFLLDVEQKELIKLLDEIIQYFASEIRVSYEHAPVYKKLKEILNRPAS